MANSEKDSRMTGRPLRSCALILFAIALVLSACSGSGTGTATTAGGGSGSGSGEASGSGSSEGGSSGESTGGGTSGGESTGSGSAGTTSSEIEMSTGGMSLVVAGQTYAEPTVTLQATSGATVSLTIQTAPDTQLVCIRSKSVVAEGEASSAVTRCISPTNSQVTYDKTAESSEYLMVNSYADPDSEDGYQGSMGITITVQ